MLPVACSHRTMMKTAPSEYDRLYENVTSHIGPDRKPTLIGLDGKGGAGKSSAANWLAWQFGIAAIHLDLFLARPVDQGPIEWRIDDLTRCIEARGHHRCLILEGVLLLDALSKIAMRQIGFLIFVECKPNYLTHPTPFETCVTDPREFALENQVEAYLKRTHSRQSANFILSWQEP